MDGSLIVVFVGITMVFALTPGIDWAYAIASGMQPRGVIPGVSGMLLGHLGVVLIVCVGLASIFTQSSSLMIMISAAGAGYLVWLGATAIRTRNAGSHNFEAVPMGARRIFAKGAGVSLLNPKVFLMYLALLPQFTSPQAAWPPAVQMFALGLMAILACAVVYYPVGFSVSAAIARKPNLAAKISLASGVLMMLLGVLLLVESVLKAVA